MAIPGLRRHMRDGLRLILNIIIQSLHFAVNVSSLIVRNPSPNGARFARRAVGHVRIGVQARAGRVSPGAPAVSPRRDDPALARGGARRRKRSLKPLVLVGLLLEPSQ